MSNIKTDLIRSGDTRLIRAEIRSNYTRKYDFASISFVCDGRSLEIISTSSGKIVGSQIETGSNIGNLDVYIEYCTQGNLIECLIGHYRSGELIHHESLTDSFNNHQSIKELSLNVPKLRSIKSSFNKRFDDFNQVVDRFKSSWLINLEYKNDFIFV